MLDIERIPQTILLYSGDFRAKSSLMRLEENMAKELQIVCTGDTAGLAAGWPELTDAIEELGYRYESCFNDPEKGYLRMHYVALGKKELSNPILRDLERRIERLEDLT